MTTGNGGTVSKVQHTITKQIMARKVFKKDLLSNQQIIHVEAKSSVRKQILRELDILHHCDSPYIVSFFGAFQHDHDISMCMEFMNCGSLDHVYKKTGAVSEEITGKIAHSVLSGLVYLYTVLKIIHRGIQNLYLFFH